MVEEAEEMGFFNETFKISTVFVAPYFGLKNSTEPLQGNDKYEGYAVGEHSAQKRVLST